MPETTETVETTTPANSETQAAQATDNNKTQEKTPAELQAELAEAQKRIRELNRENTDRRKRLEAFEQAESERKQAELSETDKLKAKLDAAERAQTEALAKANARVLRAEILAKAAGRFIDPEDVVTALSAKLTVNDDGAVDGLDDALKELEKTKPHWVRKAGATMGATNPANGTGGETDAQRRARLYGGGGSIFDKGTGSGGVFFPEKQ